MKYVDDYTGFSGDPELQAGNYLVLHFADEVEGATIQAEVIGGSGRRVTLDSDGILISRITSNEQAIKITVTKEGYETVERTYDLSGLTLEEA